MEDRMDLIPKEILEKPRVQSLLNKICTLRKNEVLFPSEEDMFTAYQLTPLDSAKVILVIPSPSDKPLESHGLGFSSGYDFNLDLTRVARKIKIELGIDMIENPDLTRWAEQGVLMLTGTLISAMMNEKKYLSSAYKVLTGEVVEYLVKQDRPKVFINLKGLPNYLFGFTNSNNLVIHGYPPNTFSFFSKDYFKPANDFLINHGLSPIDWF